MRRCGGGVGARLIEVDSGEGGQGIGIICFCFWL